LSGTPPISAEKTSLITLTTMRSLAYRLGLFVFSITIFILALLLMKEGARPLAPLIRNHFSVNSPASALGFGWLSASLALSGSPIAATALTFLDAGVLSPAETFAMIAGSRLGAAFLVLLVGFIYLLRGKQREVSLGVGLLSLLTTQTIYPPVVALGFYLLSRDWVQRWQFSAGNQLNSPFELLFGGLINGMKHLMPVWVLFPVGFACMFTSLWLFDKVLPDLHLQDSKLGQVHRLLYRPIVNFILGAGVTALTMSVSVSLSLLVPLSARGYIRRENVIPYILGANITTFIDTLIAAALLTNPAAVTVVLVQMISVTTVSLIILATSFQFYERTIERLVTIIGRRRRNLLVYIVLVLGIPLALLLFA
jgi:sodium-dependent phosphate cotransporter